MAKVLILDGKDGQIHLTKNQFANADETICGKKLYPKNAVHTSKLRVTCPKCIKLMSESQLTQALNDIQNEMGILFIIAKSMGYTAKTTIGGVPAVGNRIVDNNVYVDKARIVFEFEKIPEAIKYNPKIKK